MSTINTNGISVNYPVPGVNNNSQGFRDNFASIKTNLDTAGTEITDLQNNVIVKSALANTVINNDMGNTLISNALTRGFRSTTYNLGNDLTGTIVIDVSLGDVQYGTLAADTTLTFKGWSDVGTQSSVELQFDVTANIAAVLTFPFEIYGADCLGVTTLENFDGISSVTIPAGVCQINYLLTTRDCGSTIAITPINRPRRSTQIRQRTPAPTGLPGDVAGTVAVDTNYIYVCTDSYDATEVTTSVSTSTAGANTFSLYDTTLFQVNAPIMFTQNDTYEFGGITFNTIYYIKSISAFGLYQTITISDTRTGGVADAERTIYSGSGSMTAVSYNGLDIWKRASLDAVIPPGGTNGYVLQTNGAGGLSWVAQTGGSGSTPGGTNTQIQFNNAGVMGGVAAFTFNKSTNVVNLAGDIMLTGDYHGQDFIASGNVTSPGYVIGGAIASNSLIIATGNITGANLIGPLANGTSNIAMTSGGNIAMTVGGIANVVVVSSTGGNVTGTLGVSGNVTGGNVIGTASIGYATGSGGAVTQTVSRTTAVAINKITGAITLFTVAGASAYTTFTVNNSTVAATDVIIVNQKSGTDKYETYISNVNAGSFNITFSDTSGTTSEVVVFNFAVIKGVAA